MPRTVVHSSYRGYPLQIDQADILVFSPDGKDMACFLEMSRVRRWVRLHRRSLREQEEEGGGPKSSAGAAQSHVLPPRPVVLAQAKPEPAMSGGRVSCSAPKIF